MQEVTKSLEMVNTIAQAIYDKKGINILALDVTGISSLTDYIVIAEGHVDKHVIAIAKAIEEELSKKGQTLYKSEGMQVGDWVVLDYFNVMVHIFMPGLREKYNLENLWPESKIVDLDITLAPQESGSKYYL